MIEAVGRRIVPYPRIETSEQQSDALAARRVEENRRLVVATLEQQQQERVRVAVRDYMAISALPASSSISSLPQVRKAYSDV